MFTRILIFAFFLLAFATTLAAQRIRTEPYRGRDVVSGEILVKFRGTTVAQGRALASTDVDITSTEPAGQSGAILLRSRGRNVAALLQTYAARPDVEYAEPNYMWYATDIPNDALFGQQYGLRNTGQPIQGVAGTTGADISARQAWDITEGSRNVVVGVVDTGIDYTHPDLAANVWSAPRSFTVTLGGQTITCAEGTHGFNAITRTCDPLDDNGHGTHVSGIIGASGNNGAGVSGVNRVASIIGSKFLGSGGSGTTIDAIVAMDFLIQVKAIFPSAANIRVLSNSWGGGAFSQALLDEIRLAAASDMLFVAAAGNAGGTTSGNDDLTNSYPSGYDVPEIVSVAATDNRDALASFSSFGSGKVHLAAPGVNVLSTYPNGAYAFLSGTSMATPMVSGAAALVLSVCSLSTAALKADLLATVDVIPSLDGRASTGGRLNVYSAITACAGSTPSPVVLSVSPGAQRLDLNTTATLTVTATSTAGVTLAVYGLPSGVTANFNSSTIAAGTGTATLTLTAGAGSVEGTYLIGITGASGSLSRATGVLLTVGSPSIAVGQTISGTLSLTDPASLDRVGKHARLYKLTLTGSTTVTIDLKSRVFDPSLYLLSSSGSVLASDESSGGSNNARLTQTLAAGTYFIEVTSLSDGAVGDFTVSINTPTITSITPNFTAPGTSTIVQLVGTRFAAGMTLSAGSGITVTNVSGTGTTSATATLVISANASPGSRDLTVTTSEGTSNPVSFVIPESIGVGQRITTGSLSGTDRVSTLRLSNALAYSYADMYQFTLDATTSVTIDMRSDAFNDYLYLLSATGGVLGSDDNTGGGTNARVTATLNAGTYFIEATSTSSKTIGNYTLSINLPVLSSVIPIFIEQGTATPVSLTGTRFAAPLTISAGPGVAVVSNVVVTSPTVVTAVLDVASTASLGPREVTVTTAEGVSSAATVRVVPPIPTLTVGQPFAGTLLPSDPRTALSSAVAGDPPDVGAYADLYRISVPTTTTVTITLQSSVFDPFLSIWTPTGLFTYSNDSTNGVDTAKPSNSRITLSLTGGTTYFIEATSLTAKQTGNYTLLVSPLSLLVATPSVGLQGGVVTTLLLGGGFIPGMTIDAGPGITATVTNMLSSTLVTATFVIAPDAPLGAHNVTVTTPAGTTNAVTFTVVQSASSMPAINVGDTLSGRLSAGDQPSPQRAGQYADFYRLTLVAPTPLNIDMKSTAVNSFLYLLSSTGSTIASDDNSGGSNNARIGMVLDPGTYYVEVTSSVAGIGDYTLSATLAAPVTSASLPATGTPGAVVDVTLRGQFFIAPLTIDAGTDIAVTNINVVNATTATARFSISAGAALGDRAVTATSVYGTSDPLFFNLTLVSQLNFPRSNTAAEMKTTGFAVVNPGPLDAAVTFTMYNSTGAQLGVSNQFVPARGQFSKLGSELFPSVTQAGWVQATSTTPGLQALWLGGDFTTIMDGADSAPAAREMIFPLVNIAAPPEINVVNVSSAANSVTFRLFGTSGVEFANAAALTVNIPPNGVFRSSVTAIYPLFPILQALTGIAPMYIRATGTRNIAGTAVTANYLISPSWTVLNGMDTARQVTEIDFPHVPSGGTPAWTSMLGVTNFSTTASQIVTITFTPNTGSPVTASRLLNSGGALLESVQTMFGFSTAYQEGWVKVTGPLPLNGFIFYGFAGSGGATTVAGQSAARIQMIFDHVATGPSWNTGLALLNNSTVDANVEVYVLRATGALVGSAAFTLPRGTKIARQLTEWVPASAADDGFVFVRTTNGIPLYAIQLFYSRDNRVIANIPAAGIDPSITYTPPAQ